MGDVMGRGPGILEGPPEPTELQRAQNAALVALRAKWAREAPDKPEPVETYVMEFRCTFSELKEVQLAVKGFCPGRKRCYLKRKGDM